MLIMYDNSIELILVKTLPPQHPIPRHYINLTLDVHQHIHVQSSVYLYPIIERYQTPQKKSLKHWEKNF